MNNYMFKEIYCCGDFIPSGMPDTEKKICWIDSYITGQRSGGIEVWRGCGVWIGGKVIRKKRGKCGMNFQSQTF